MARPSKYSEEVRERAVRMVWEWRRERHVTTGGVNPVAAQLGINKETLRNWVRQADVDDGVVDGQTSSEQNELVQLRREKRRLEMENEILRRAAAYFAAGSLPK